MESKKISFELINDKTIFPDLPSSGPLYRYRRNSKFDYRKLAIIVDGEKCLRFRKSTWKRLEEDPLFARSREEMTLDQKRELNFRKLNKLIEWRTEISPDSELLDAFRPTVVAYDTTLPMKIHLSSRMFPDVIKATGTERLFKYAEDAERGIIHGCYALTEVAHGSNTLGMRTTATYDAKNRQFVINTPDFQAAKCWPGNLGKTATHAIVYAQLYTPDGKHHGLNAFMVPIRSTTTLEPFAGVIVGDLGEKIGANGMDNGFVMFNHYRIPKDFLLARYGDISNDGRFITPIKSSKKRMSASFGALTGGRVGICANATTHLISAISIAVRYSASRTQFKDDNAIDELPVLEYQSQQYRLLPHLCSAIAQRIFTNWFLSIFTKFSTDKLPLYRNEIHVISSAVKPFCTWTVRDAIQDCREATGGHGYLKISGLGDIRSDNDLNITVEGENNVLIQQASNWLLSCRKTGFASFLEASPLKSAQFLHASDKILKQTCTWTTKQEAMNPQNALIALDWLVAWLLEKTYQHSVELRQSGMNAFQVRNNTQLFHAQTLSIVYAQRMILSVFLDFVTKLEKTAERGVLERIASLYGANLLQSHLLQSQKLMRSKIDYFRSGGYVTSSRPIELLKAGIIELLPVLKDDAIPLVDAIAPNDFILNSPLGMSDGQVYKHLQAALWQSPSTFERPKWWQLVTHWKNNTEKSKL